MVFSRVSGVLAAASYLLVAACGGATPGSNTPTNAGEQVEAVDAPDVRSEPTPDLVDPIPDRERTATATAEPGSGVPPTDGSKLTPDPIDPTREPDATATPSADPEPDESSFAVTLFDSAGGVWILDPATDDLNPLFMLDGLPIEGHGESPDGFIEYAIWSPGVLFVGTCCEPADGAVWAQPLDLVTDLTAGPPQRMQRSALDLSRGFDGSILAVEAVGVRVYNHEFGSPTAAEPVWQFDLDPAFSAREGSWLDPDTAAYRESDGSTITFLRNGELIRRTAADGDCYQAVADSAVLGQLLVVRSDRCWNSPFCCGSLALESFTAADEEPSVVGPLPFTGVRSMVATASWVVAVDHEGTTWVSADDDWRPIDSPGVTFTAAALIPLPQGAG